MQDGFQALIRNRYETNRNKPLFFIPKVQNETVVLVPFIPAITVFLSEPRVCHQLSQSEVICYTSAQSFGKTCAHTLTQKHNSRSLCGTVLSIEKSKHKEGFFCSIFGLKDSGSFHVALTQTHTG